MDADEKDILDKRTDKTKVQGTDKTIERKKRPLKENTLLNNPNLSMGEKEKAVKKQATEEIKKVFKGMPDLRKMIDMSTKFETQKILREQEKFQGNKTFLEMISGMKLSPGTISNRAEMSDKGVYDNFKDYLERGKKERPKSEKEFRTGNTFIIGREEEKEHFKILGIKETDSGMKAVILGNEKTKDVEIVFEGTNPGLTDIQKNPKEWSRDWSNNLRNMTSDKRRNLKAFLPTELKIAISLFEDGTKKYSQSNEEGTPKSYIDALKIAREVQEEYRNGKDGYKGLSMVSGHSKGGGEAIYVASHLDLQAIAVDPAPVTNPGRYFYNDKILTIVPDNGKGSLNRTKENQIGTTTLSSVFGILGVGEKMNYLPAVKVEAYKDPKNNGKTDSHKTDSKSMERVEKEILKQIKLNEKIIRGDRNA